MIQHTMMVPQASCYATAEIPYHSLSLIPDCTIMGSTSELVLQEDDLSTVRKTRDDGADA